MNVENESFLDKTSFTNLCHEKSIKLNSKLHFIHEQVFQLTMISVSFLSPPWSLSECEGVKPYMSLGHMVFEGVKSQEVNVDTKLFELWRF